MPRNAKNNAQAQAVKPGLAGLVQREAANAKGSSSGLMADWRLVDAMTLLSCILAVTEAGGGVLVGTDSTGFGYTLNVYSGKEKVSKWFRPDQEGIDALHAFLEQVTAACQE